MLTLLITISYWPLMLLRNSHDSLQCVCHVSFDIGVVISYNRYNAGSSQDQIIEFQFPVQVASAQAPSICNIK